MERKLLSLPNFFVLLLVAGIAFLAAPVVDVHADAPTATISRTTPSGTGEAPAGNVVYTIDFSEPVKETGTGTGQVASWLGFGPEDIIVMIAQDAAPEGDGGSETLGPGRYTLAKASNNEDFTVTVTVPTNSRGDISVTLKAANTSTTTEAATLTTEASFTATAVSADHYATTSTVVSSLGYNTYDGTKPTVIITAGAGATGDGSGATQTISVTGGEGQDDRFQLEFQFSEPLGSGDAGFAHAADVSIVTTPETLTSSVVTSGPKPGAAEATPTFIVIIDPADKATKVTVGVKKDAVADANGNKLDPAYTKEITINARPTVAISIMVPAVPATATTQAVPAKPVPDPIPTDFTSAIEVTFQFSAEPGFGGTTATNFQESDITVTNGTLQAGSGGRDTSVLPTDTVKATYTAMVTLPAAADRKSPFTIAVAAGSFRIGTLDNTASEESRDVTIPTTTGPTTQPPDPMGIGDELPNDRRGFSFTLPAMPPPTATDGSDRFVVLAKAANLSTDNGLSVPASRFVDIKDSVWQDLADFLAYDGGTINLIGPNGTVKNTLVISEIMWGGDAYLSDPTKSQWIELYNATTTRGSANDGSIPAGQKWEIEFHAGTGLVSTQANLSDSFSNRELGNAHWDIPNVSGGKYGQSGRTQLTPGTPGSLRDLVSMRRKIDYAKVENTKHKADGAANDVANRAEQVKGIPDGALAGSWEASTSRVNMSGTRKGTPGARHVVVVGTTGISKSVVFNEIANRSTAKFDWIELYNPGSSDVKINNWVLSKVTAVDKDEKLVKFESDENIVVPAKGFLLVVNEDPSETALAAGANVNNPNSKGNNLPTKVYVNSGLNIPTDKYLLILRTEEKLGSHEKIVDIGGHLAGLTLVHTGSATELWPLKAWKRIKEDDLKEDDSKTWVRDKGKDLYHGDAWKLDGGFTGLGIDRNPASASNRGPTSGTPGFDNGAIKDKVKDLKESNPVVISEIMFGTGSSGRRVPQWIELYNPSDMQAVKLNSWRLEVRNTNDPSESLNVELSYTLILPDVRVLPKQTVLIVSSSIGESTRNRFPSDRIINLWSNRSFRDITEATSPRDPILSSVGFYIKLSDPEKQVVDEVGNIDGTRRSDDTPDWILPGGNLEDGGRASMIRREGTFNDGTIRDSWISANATNFAGKVGIKELYYGDEDDIGTPGYRAGGPLPVQLSSFYSKRNDAGAVVITWSTESELDNAGFNILRSLSRVGEFTRINAQLIPGAGTTGEKNTYTWTDTSARPNVVYYYQIEDVSLDGEHRTLRTTRLRGYVGAAGKATTIWGELKSRD